MLRPVFCAQISFASVSVPMYNSEMAPPQLRGRLTQLFQVILTFAIFAAQVSSSIINLRTFEGCLDTRICRLGCAFQTCNMFHA